MRGWNLENALNLYSPFLASKKYGILPKFTDTEITQERLQKSYQIAAFSVKEYGDVYLPIFERLHNELEDIKIKQSLLNTAFKVAKNENQETNNS